MDTLSKKPKNSDLLEKLDPVIDKLKKIESELKHLNVDTRGSELSEKAQVLIEDLVADIQESYAALEHVQDHFPLSGNVQQEIMPYWHLFRTMTPQYGFMNFAMSGEDEKASARQKEQIKAVSDVVHILLDRLDIEQLSASEQRLIRRFQTFE